MTEPTKWTRKQVLDMAERVASVGWDKDRGKQVSTMLTDLAPPEEPRTWKEKDLLKHDDIVWVVTSVKDDRVNIRSVFGHSTWTCTTLQLKDAVPLKLVEDVS